MNIAIRSFNLGDIDLVLLLQYAVFVAMVFVGLIIMFVVASMIGRCSNRYILLLPTGSEVVRLRDAPLRLLVVGVAVVPLLYLYTGVLGIESLLLGVLRLGDSGIDVVVVLLNPIFLGMLFSSFISVFSYSPSSSLHLIEDDTLTTGSRTHPHGDPLIKD